MYAETFHVQFASQQMESITKLAASLNRILCVSVCKIWELSYICGELKLDYDTSIILYKFSLLMLLLHAEVV